MTASNTQRSHVRPRRRSSLLLALSLAAAATAGASPSAPVQEEPQQLLRRTGGEANPYGASKDTAATNAANAASNMEGEEAGRKLRRGAPPAANADENKDEAAAEDGPSGNNAAAETAEEQQQRRITVIDLSAPLFDEAVVPHPLEPNRSPPADRGLKKDKAKDKANQGEYQTITVIDAKAAAAAGTTTTTYSHYQSKSLINTANAVHYVSSTTLDLTQAAPVALAPPSCFESKPLMGCDRGGGVDQRLTFFGHDFGLGCAQADPCLFALMPIRMAYYCPRQGRPKCGGRCYTVAQHCPPNGILVDRTGQGHNVTDPMWQKANADAWNYWPGNFGCPHCVG